MNIIKNKNPQFFETPESSTILWVLKTKEDLYIAFKNKNEIGSVYKFLGASTHFEEMSKAKSKGKYHHNKLKGYKYERIK